jgi:D-xylose 1-dehydrogenase
MTADPLARFARYPSLVDRVAFVSGGSTGLGAEYVVHLAAQGTRVAFVDIDVPAGQALVESIKARGYAEPIFIECDVRDIAALQRAIAETRERLGLITILVNNAANDARHRIEETSVALWDERMAVNVRHHFFAAQAVLPMMKEAGGGSIINIGSISAHIDLLDLPTYITAKAGIEGLTKTLARELGKFNIRVNCIIPGWVMTERQLRDWVTPEAAASIDANQCLKHRLYPDDIARMVLWLAADDSRSCTAQNWTVDGGWIK